MTTLRSRLAFRYALIVAICLGFVSWLMYHEFVEEPAAVVTLKAGMNASEDELRAFVGEHLAAFKVPVRIAFASEPLPRNAPGKIMKPQLRAFFA